MIIHVATRKKSGQSRGGGDVGGGGGGWPERKKNRTNVVCFVESFVRWGKW